MVAEPLRRSTTNPRKMIVAYTQQILDRAVERPDRVSVREIVEDVRRKFLTDQAFVMSLALMNTDEIVNAAVREGIAATRGSSRRVIVRGIITTPDEHVRESRHLIEQLALRWGTFREWNGEVHVRLPAMTRVDLLAAARIRRERADRELAYAVFFERLAAHLPDDAATVGESVPFEQIEREYVTAQELCGRLDGGAGEGVESV